MKFHKKNPPGCKSSVTVFIFSKRNIFKRGIKIKREETSRKLAVHPDGEIMAERDKK
jgi:hypothetical protein